MERDRRTDMMKLIVACHNIVNATKKLITKPVEPEVIKQISAEWWLWYSSTSTTWAMVVNIF
jgi:hypothetical protein